MRNFESATNSSNASENYDNYLMRPLSPSMSISQLEKSSFYFGGSFEFNKLINDMRLITDDFLDKGEISATHDRALEIYNKRVREIEQQIVCIKNLHDKEVNAHEQERIEFETKYGKIRRKLEGGEEFINRLERGKFEQQSRGVGSKFEMSDMKSEENTENVNRSERKNFEQVARELDKTIKKFDSNEDFFSKIDRSHFEQIDELKGIIQDMYRLQQRISAYNLNLVRP